MYQCSVTKTNMLLLVSFTIKLPEQTERIITIEKEQVEGFQMYCARQFIVWFTDIPVNFLETQGGVKCIFGANYEKQMKVAVENYKSIQSELSQIGMEVANALTEKMSESQKEYFLSESRQLGDMDFYETNIKFDDDNLLLENYSFVKLKANGDDEPKLTVTDKSGNFVVLSAKSVDRSEVESKIRSYLKINDSETIKAILDKSERLGFAEQPKQVQFKEFQIERDTQSSFIVRGAPSRGGGSTVVRLDLNNKESAKKQLMDAFGISAGKAEKIIGKAQKQKVADNLLKKARKKVKDAADTIRHKKIERGSRK